jgi:hypothetical protein
VVAAGASIVQIDNATRQQTGTLELRSGTTNAVTIRFRDASGQDEPVIATNRAAYEIRPGQIPAGVTFTQAPGGVGASYNISITPTANGPLTFSFLLFNLDHDHSELQHNVTASVGSAPALRN